MNVRNVDKLDPKECFHIFKDAGNKHLAICGYEAKNEPKLGREPFPKCPSCLEWFKNLVWKKEEKLK